MWTRRISTTSKNSRSTFVPVKQVNWVPGYTYRLWTWGLWKPRIFFSVPVKQVNWVPEYTYRLWTWGLWKPRISTTSKNSRSTFVPVKQVKWVPEYTYRLWTWGSWKPRISTTNKNSRIRYAVDLFDWYKSFFFLTLQASRPHRRAERLDFFFLTASFFFRVIFFSPDTASEQVASKGRATGKVVLGFSRRPGLGTFFTYLLLLALRVQKYGYCTATGTVVLGFSRAGLD